MATPYALDQLAVNGERSPRLKSPSKQRIWQMPHVELQHVPWWGELGGHIPAGGGGGGGHNAGVTSVVGGRPTTAPTQARVSPYRLPTTRGISGGARSLQVVAWGGTYLSLHPRAPFFRSLQLHFSFRFLREK